MRLTKKWWFVIVVLPVIGLCVKAGFWQLDRAQQKEQLIERLTVGESQLSTPSDLLMADPDSATYRVTLLVMIDHDSVFYLDNRIQDRVAGYEVFAEASTRDGGLRLLVNLGWVPGSPTRAQLPEISVPDQFQLDALWVPMTESYLMSDAFAETVDGRLRVQSLRAVATDGVLPGVFLASGLLTRDALGPKPRLGPETHYGYAVQWFLLAMVLAGLSTYVLRRGLSYG
jgi:surfeit locus 1 family protein